MRKKIIDAAFEKFCEKGYRASLSEMAEAVGIKKQSIYNYFPNKDSLLYEMINIEISGFFESNRSNFEICTGKTTEEKLKYIFLSILEYFKDSKRVSFWRWLILIESERLKKKVIARLRENEVEFGNFIKSVFERGVELGEIDIESERSIRRFFNVVIHGTADSLMVYGSMINKDEFILDIWNNFWRGIGK